MWFYMACLSPNICTAWRSWRSLRSIPNNAKHLSHVWPDPISRPSPAWRPTDPGSQKKFDQKARLMATNPDTCRHTAAEWPGYLDILFCGGISHWYGLRFINMKYKKMSRQFVSQDQECGHLYPGPLHVIALVAWWVLWWQNILLELWILYWKSSGSNDDGGLSHLIPPTHQV